MKNVTHVGPEATCVTSPTFSTGIGRGKPTSMDEPQGMSRWQAAGWRFGQRHPRTVAFAFGGAFMAFGVVAIILAAVNWGETDLPAALFATGLVAGALMSYSALWAWRRDYEATHALALGLWIVPVGAMFVAIQPDVAPGFVAMPAYGFLTSYFLGAVVLVRVGLRARARMSEDEVNSRAVRSYEWMRGR